MNRDNDEKFSDNADKTNESNKTVTSTGDGSTQDKKNAKFEPESTNGGVETSTKRNDPKTINHHMFL